MFNYYNSLKITSLVPLIILELLRHRKPKNKNKFDIKLLTALKKKT